VRRAKSSELDAKPLRIAPGGEWYIGAGGPEYLSQAVPQEPLAELPDEVTLARDEAALILFALDVVEQAEVDPEERAKVTRAIRMLTAKLWSDLGDLLNGAGET
jgi:hypothetical protein